MGLVEKVKGYSEQIERGTQKSMISIFNWLLKMGVAGFFSLVTIFSIQENMTPLGQLSKIFIFLAVFGSLYSALKTMAVKSMLVIGFICVLLTSVFILYHRAGL